MINEIRVAATPAVNAATPDAGAPGAGDFGDVLRQALPGEPQAQRAPADPARADDAPPPQRAARAPDADAAAQAGDVEADSTDTGRTGFASHDTAAGTANATRGRSATPARTTRAGATPPRPSPSADAAAAGQSDAARTILADTARATSLAGASAAAAGSLPGTTGVETGTGEDSNDGTSEKSANGGVVSDPSTPAIPVAQAVPVAAGLPGVLGATGAAIAASAATTAAGANPVVADADRAAPRATGAARRTLPDEIGGTVAGDDLAATPDDTSSAVAGTEAAQDASGFARGRALARGASTGRDENVAGSADGQRTPPGPPSSDAARAIAPTGGTNITPASSAPAGRRAEPTLETALAALPRALSSRGQRESAGPDAADGASGGFAGMLATAAWNAPSPATGVADAVPQFPIGTPPSDPQFPSALSEQVATIALAGLDRAEIQLAPRELGPIRIELSLSGESASIAFSAALPETRQAIEQSLPTLRTMLADHGIELSQASVGQGRDGGAGGGGAASYAAGTPRSASRSAADSGAPAATSVTIEPRRSRGLLDLFA